MPSTCCTRPVIVLRCCCARMSPQLPRQDQRTCQSTANGVSVALRPLMRWPRRLDAAMLW
jgi:hypothetical protein